MPKHKAKKREAYCLVWNFLHTAGSSWGTLFGALFLLMEDPHDYQLHSQHYSTRTQVIRVWHMNLGKDISICAMEQFLREHFIFSIGHVNI